MLIVSDPNVTDDHVQNVSDVGSDGSSCFTHAQVDDEVTAPEEMKDRGDKLYYDRDLGEVLGGEELLG
jgi:hypothetical protein